MSRVQKKEQAATKLSGARISPLAGKPAPREMLVDLARLEKEYFDRSRISKMPTSSLCLAQAATAGRL
jgi:hypothetical protein